VITLEMVETISALVVVSVFLGSFVSDDEMIEKSGVVSIFAVVVS
jgi:hypothetical protein